MVNLRRLGVLVVVLGQSTVTAGCLPLPIPLMGDPGPPKGATPVQTAAPEATATETSWEPASTNVAMETGSLPATEAALFGRWDGPCLPQTDHALRLSYDFGDGTDGVTLFGWIYADAGCTQLTQAVAATGRFTVPATALAPAGAAELDLDFGECTALDEPVTDANKTTAVCQDVGLSAEAPRSVFQVVEVDGDTLRLGKPDATNDATTDLKRPTTLDDQSFKRRGS